MRGRCSSGSPLQASSGSTMWPSASTTGPALGGSGRDWACGCGCGCGCDDAAVTAASGAGGAPVVTLGERMTEQAGRIAAGDGAQLLRRECPPVLEEDALGVRPGRVGVRVVALHHDVV